MSNLRASVEITLRSWNRPHSGRFITHKNLRYSVACGLDEPGVYHVVMAGYDGRACVRMARAQSAAVVSRRILETGFLTFLYHITHASLP